MYFNYSIKHIQSKVLKLLWLNGIKTPFSSYNIKQWNSASLLENKITNLVNNLWQLFQWLDL